MAGSKYGFAQSFPDELVEDMGREQLTELAKDMFQHHLDSLGLHRVDGPDGDFDMHWSALPHRLDPPEETRRERFWRWLRRIPPMEPVVLWPVYGHTRVTETEQEFHARMAPEARGLRPDES